MPDIWEIDSPYGVLEVESDHQPTYAEARTAIREYADTVNKTAQERAAAQGASPLAAPSMENVGRFLANAGEVLNPITAVTGIGHAIAHPIDTATGIVGQMGEQWGKAGEAGRQMLNAPNPDQARLSMYEMLGHATAGTIPIVGPMAAQAGEQIAAGDVAGGLGRGVGLTAPFAVGAAMKLRNAPNPRAADILTRQAEEQVSGKVLGPGNPKYKGRAAAIAPEVLARKLTGGREQLQQAAVEGMAEAAQRIDDGVQAAGGITAQIPEIEVTSRLDAVIKSLQDSSGQPLSSRAAKRIAAVQQRIAQVKKLAGTKGTVSYEDLKNIRDESYDLSEAARGYERTGNIEMSDEGWAARETGGSIRETFAARSNTTAAANADYAFFKSLHDVLDPVLGRPKNTAPTSGVTGGERVSGAVAGSLVSPKLAFVMGTVIPWLRQIRSTPAWQLADAQSKLRLAAAIRAGDMGRMKSLMVKIGEAVPVKPPAGQPTPAPNELNLTIRSNE
jgi:hypothetical protein